MNLDLEIDCPSDNGTANERNAYEELQNYNSSGPCEFHILLFLTVKVLIF